MNCAEFEIALADYLDGTLPPDGRAAVELHAASCAGCRELLDDALQGISLLKIADPVAPPAELITRLAYQAPIGRTRQPFEVPGFFSRWANLWLRV